MSFTINYNMLPPQIQRNLEEHNGFYGFLPSTEDECFTKEKHTFAEFNAVIEPDDIITFESYDYYSWFILRWS